MSSGPEKAQGKDSTSPPQEAEPEKASEPNEEEFVLGPEDYALLEKPVEKEDVVVYHAKTARLVAMILVSGFLVLMSLPFVYLFVSLYWINPKPTPDVLTALVSQTEDLIKTVASVLSGLVGAVLVYYFGVEKRQHHEDNESK